MNKAKIKDFAIWAREKLISDITYKAGMLGITEEGIKDALPQSTNDLKFYDVGTKNYAEVRGKDIKQREALVSAIRDKEKDSESYKDAFEFIVEEVAYTWFNRLIAIRFMEVNDYLPSGIRVLSSENSAKLEPDFVTNPFETDLEFTDEEVDKVLDLKDKNKSDDLFRMLFIKQCNKLNEILPELFEKTEDYTELLLTISFTEKEGIVYHLTHDIDEEEFDIENNGQVEILGWMYQYYISDKHEKVVDPLHAKTIKKDDIPAATQLFTTDWVVKYMVDNSLGRYWIERNPHSVLPDKLEFFVKPKNGHITYINERCNPIDLSFFDPCMGSGHILVYAFDVLMEIYRECGYTDREAARSIVENNLFGVDIDKRAYQLSYFAIMMKARSYDRRILSKNIENNISFIEESNNIDSFACNPITYDNELNRIGEYLIEIYKNAREYGSLQLVVENDYKKFNEYLHELNNIGYDGDIFSLEWTKSIIPVMIKLTKQASIMSRKYSVVCTNPPYMNKFEGNLKKFINEQFKEYKGDLFSAFMYRNFEYCVKDGYSAFMTPNVWMFIKAYEQLREYIIENKKIVSLIQMAKGAFFKEATVDICCFVLQNSLNHGKGHYIRLEDFKGDMDVQRKKVLESLQNNECNYVYETNQSKYRVIQGNPIAYWIDDRVFDIFKNECIDKKAISNGQNITGDNNKYLRLFWEVNFKNVNKNYWSKCARGGGYRKYYGNDDTVILWTEAARCHYHQDKIARIISEELRFKEGITWSYITSSIPSFRKLSSEELFEKAGTSIFIRNKKELNYLLGFLNSEVAKYLLNVVSPTINYQVRDIFSLPVIKDMFKNKRIEEIVEENIFIEKYDWDILETSWDFKRNLLVEFSKVLWDCTYISAIMNKYYGYLPEVSCPMEITYLLYKGECEERFKTLKSNEEELNRMFIDIYGLQDELTADVEDKDITVYRIFDTKEDIPESMGKSKYALTKQDVIKNFVSYAVGCMLGRYSLDVEGLAYAGGEWDESKYRSFIPDADNCIPITDEEYFEDDIVGRFVEFVRAIYGDDSLEENLIFIADALGNKGKTSREVIRNYFLNDFIKEHNKKYQKRPIYWMFDSGKQNGFKALVYMHRWNADTVGNVRVEYLHKMQHIYEREIERMQEIIDNSHDNKEINKAEKNKQKLQKQLKEAKDYDAKIAHIALSRIDIDLDDGVKVNYEKVQKGQDGKNMNILAKI